MHKVRYEIVRVLFTSLALEYKYGTSVTSYPMVTSWRGNLFPTTVPFRGEPLSPNKGTEILSFEVLVVVSLNNLMNTTKLAPCYLSDITVYIRWQKKHVCPVF